MRQNIVFLEGQHPREFSRRRVSLACRVELKDAGGGNPRLPLTLHVRVSSLAALAEITEMVAQLHGTMIKMENFQKLHELKKDLIGIDNLVIPGRVSGCTLSCIGGQAREATLRWFTFTRFEYRYFLLKWLPSTWEVIGGNP